MKSYYLILGSDNFWYAILKRKRDIERETLEIKKHISLYADPENFVYRERLPERLYIYKATEIKEIKMGEAGD